MVTPLEVANCWVEGNPHLASGQVQIVRPYRQPPVDG